MIIEMADAERISSKLVVWLQTHPLHQDVEHLILMMFLRDHDQQQLEMQVAEYVAWGGPLADAKVLCRSEAEEVRLAIVCREDTPVDWFVRFVDDVSHRVRGVVALRSTDPKHLYQLSFDSNEFVRGEVARNWFTPKEVLEVLCKDEFEWIRNNALKTLETQGYF